VVWFERVDKKREDFRLTSVAEKRLTSTDTMYVWVACAPTFLAAARRRAW
jgi:hypothetical protein